MKKFRILFLCLLTLVLVTGCKTESKEQKLVCTTTENEEGMDVDQVISMTYQNDKLKHMTMEVNFKITDQQIQQKWADFKKAMDESNEEFNKGGVSLKVAVDDAKYEYKTTLDIDVLNASDDVLEEQGFSDIKEDDSTLEETKAEAEKDGAICTIE